MRLREKSKLKMVDLHEGLDYDVVKNYPLDENYKYEKSFDSDNLEPEHGDHAPLFLSVEESC